MKRDFFGESLKIGDYVLYLESREDSNEIRKYKCKIIKETNCFFYIVNAHFGEHYNYRKRIKPHNLIKWKDNVIGPYFDTNGHKIKLID